MLGMDTIGCICRRRSSVATVGSVVVPPCVTKHCCMVYAFAVSVACVHVHHEHAAPDSFRSDVCSVDQQYNLCGACGLSVKGAGSS